MRRMVITIAYLLIGITLAEPGGYYYPAPIPHYPAPVPHYPAPVPHYPAPVPHYPPPPPNEYGLEDFTPEAIIPVVPEGSGPEGPTKYHPTYGLQDFVPDAPIVVPEVSNDIGPLEIIPNYPVPVVEVRHYPTPVLSYPAPVPHYPAPVPHYPTPVPHYPAPVPHYPAPVSIPTAEYGLSDF